MRFKQFLTEAAEPHPDLAAIVRILQHISWTRDSVNPALNAPPHALYCEFPLVCAPYEWSTQSSIRVEHVKTHHLMSNHTGLGVEHTFMNEMNGDEFTFNLVWHAPGWWSQTDGRLARNQFMHECSRVFGARYVSVDATCVAVILQPGTPVNADEIYGPYQYKKYWYVSNVSKPIDIGNYKDPFEQEGS